MTVSRFAVAIVPLLLTDPTPRHPLDPLSAAEIRTAVAVVAASGRVSESARYASIALAEPSKPIQGATAPVPPSRSAELVLYDWEREHAARAVVDLGTRRLSAWQALDTRQPPTGALVVARLAEALGGDLHWADALRRRGIDDPRSVRPLPALGEGDTLALGADGRTVRLGSGYLPEAAPPNDEVLGGWDVVVNLTRGTVTRFVDSLAAVPRKPSRLARRTSPDALFSPGRPSPRIAVRGSGVRWHSWVLRFAVHPRRGLELFDVAWLDGATRRPILYRASLVELMAAYGDPGFASWYPFDEGSYGLGTYGASSMTPGIDAPADAHFADAVLHDEYGRPRVVPRAAAVYERDGGLLWRHAGTACRARELVVASHTTIDNYDYVFEWTFSDDGSIRADVAFTGAMNMVPHRARHDSLPSLLLGGVTAVEVGDRIRAPIHQHFLSFRLDFDLDPERRDMVVEVDGVPGPRDSGLNPGGEWFAATSRRLESERDARRPADAAAGRVWRVAASGPAGPGTGPGYVLLPGDLPTPLAAPDAKPRHKAAFASGQLWVTQYDSTQMYPAGDFPYRGRPDEGLPRWIEANRPLVGQDVVLWHTLGITHLPRTEDYPLMPARRAGFRLMPSGFFRANPAMDSAGRCPSTSPHSIR